VASFTLRPLYPRERAPGTHWIGGWVLVRHLPDGTEKKHEEPQQESRCRSRDSNRVPQEYHSTTLPLSQAAPSGEMITNDESERMRKELVAS
jgi:hypothetical protein